MVFFNKFFSGQLVKRHIFIHLRSIIYFHSKCNIFTRNSYFCVPWWTIFSFLCESWFILHLYRFWNIVYLYQTHYDLICLLWKLASHQYCTWLYLFVINLIISVQLCLWHVYFSIECTLWWKLSECLLSVRYNLLAQLPLSPFVCLSFFISLKLLNNVNQTWHTASLGENLSSLFNQRSHNLISK